MRRPDTIQQLQADGRIYGQCPSEADEDRQQRAEDKFTEDERQVRELAKQRGRQALPRLLREAEPVFACRGYFAQDVKPLFDPVDYIIFDGMNASSAVTRIVLFDGPALGHGRERVQRAIQRALEGRADGEGRPESAGGWAVSGAGQGSRSL
jgi:predicted Holliday junction resolvase-like endonuclease